MTGMKIMDGLMGRIFSSYKQSCNSKEIWKNLILHISKFKNIMDWFI